MAEEKQEQQQQQNNPYDMLLEKINKQEATIKAQEEKLTKMEAKFKDFSDFNKSLLNQASKGSIDTTSQDEKEKRRIELDKKCRKGEY